MFTAATILFALSWTIDTILVSICHSAAIFSEAVRTAAGSPHGAEEHRSTSDGRRSRASNSRPRAVRFLTEIDSEPRSGSYKGLRVDERQPDTGVGFADPGVRREGGRERAVVGSEDRKGR